MKTELDAWIAEHVMGWKQHHDLHDLIYHSDRFVVRDGIVYCGDENADEHGGWKCFNPAENRDMAFLVLEKCAENLSGESCGGDEIHISRDIHSWYVATQHSVHFGESSTLPLAICRFARRLFSQ